ncbi:peptidoglycan-associated lipoprotein OprL [marine gamma proteobacterium HTCC2143]|jgi:peptidoglycan-associated lipoprotein|uniref:Peptidoglycan-associated lipoprotein n=1 Tax=marine gamma proteobacterium HTCC2143 TaxID=247633 RepID=A0YEK1_9GAMM|nr:peptidoglycan-associated lipoprotein OprL [marine gamma proteobacterium HTCC2143]
MEMKRTQLLGAILASVLLVGCASNDTVEDTSDADRIAAEQAADAEAAARSAAAAAEAEAVRVAAEEAAANLQTIFYFDFDQATLSADTREALDSQIAVLNENSNKVRLEGHADERGTREYNMALAERRANAIANYMIINGVARYRVETVSYGEERPVSAGSSESSYSENRRVELK